MTGAARNFLILAIIYAIGGMILGLTMAISQDHSQMPVHAHTMVAGWLERRLDDVDLIALMIDGLHIQDHVVLIALGIDVRGHKHVLGYGWAQRRTQPPPRRCWRTSSSEGCEPTGARWW